MFISFSKTLARVGGFRIGCGIRITKKNAVWASFAVFFVALFQLMWYLTVGMLWLCYAVFYGLFWCFKGAFLGIRAISRKIVGRKK